MSSFSTLTRLTSSTKHYDDVTHYSKLVLNLTDQQKTCILLLAKVYVKSMLQYHGEKVFGQAINNPRKLANSVLSHVVVCMFGKPKFLCKIFPVKEMRTDFLFNQTNTILKNLKDAVAKVIAIICDDNSICFGFEPARIAICLVSANYCLRHNFTSSF